MIMSWEPRKRTMQTLTLFFFTLSKVYWGMWDGSGLACDWGFGSLIKFFLCSHCILNVHPISSTVQSNSCSFFFLSGHSTRILSHQRFDWSLFHSKRWMLSYWLSRKCLWFNDMRTHFRVGTERCKRLAVDERWWFFFWMIGCSTAGKTALGDLV